MSSEKHNPAAGDRSRIDVYLDDDKEPLVSYRPPLRFELDTSEMEDGPHTLRIEAYDSSGTKGVRQIPFTVRNGPGIAISGLGNNDVLEGKIPILINSYGGAVEPNWEPSRAETPAPVPTWTWVLLIFIVAFGGFYGVRQWNPPAGFATTPTYGTVAAGNPAAPANSNAVPTSNEVPATEPVSTGAPATGTSGSDPAAQEAMASDVAAATEAAAQAETAEQPDDNANSVATPVEFDAQLGASVYGSYCSACHQANGQGLPGVFPPMAGDPVVLAEDPAEHISIVLHGLQGKSIEGVAYASPMPAFAGQLSDEQIAAVINHERTSWGNEAPLVTREAVAGQR